MFQPDETIPNRLMMVMGVRKRLALIAHDHCKSELLDWARFNRGTLVQHELCATGTTGALLTSTLGLPVTRFMSGPLGGDQQVGAAIVEGRNVPIACNRSTADFLLSSPLMHREYERLLATATRREPAAVTE